MTNSISNDPTQIRVIFIEELESQKPQPNVVPENVKQAILDHMRVEFGTKVWEALHNGAGIEAHRSMLTTDALVLSLAALPSQKKPHENLNLREKLEVNHKGVKVRKVPNAGLTRDGRHRTTRAHQIVLPFKPEIEAAILPTRLLLQTNIKHLFTASENLANSLANTLQNRNKGQEYRGHTKQQKKPLYEAKTEKDLESNQWNAYTKWHNISFNIRQFLLDALANNNHEYTQIIQNANGVLFHYEFVYFLVDGELKYVPTTDKYHEFLSFGNMRNYKNARKRIAKNQQPKSFVTTPTETAVSKFGYALGNFIETTIQVKLNLETRLGEIEKFCASVRKDTGLAIDLNNARHFEILEDHEAQEKLLHFLHKINNLLKKYFKRLVLVNESTKRNLDDLQSVMMYVHSKKAETFSIINAKETYENLSEEDHIGSINISNVDIELLKKYPEDYEVTMRTIILDEIFKTIFATKNMESADKHQDYAKEFKDLFQSNFIASQSNVLANRGFSPSEPYAQWTVYRMLFLAFGSLYLQSAINNTPVQLPENIKEYFAKVLDQKETSAIETPIRRQVIEVQTL